MYKSLVDNSNDLVESCRSVNVTEGVQDIKDETDDIFKRWTALNEFYRQRKDQVAEAETKNKKYRSVLLSLENSVQKAEKSLEESCYEGIDVADGEKELEAVKVDLINI